MQTTSTSDQGSERVNAKDTKKENGIEPLTGDTRTPKQSAVKWWTALDSNDNLIQIESAHRGEKYRCYECEESLDTKKCLDVRQKLGTRNSLTLSISHSLTLNMLNNFCFHVYAQKSLLIGENWNVYFLTTSASSPSPPAL